jgi:hypothetical protein
VWLLLYAVQLQYTTSKQTERTMSQEPGATGKFSPGATALSRTSKAEIGYKGHLRISTERDDIEIPPQELPPLAAFLRDQQLHPQTQQRLELLREQIIQGNATPGAAETILFEIMVTFLPTGILRQVQEIMALLDTRTEPEQ